jgi:outer membrane receptor protein involved in Fe transport
MYSKNKISKSIKLALMLSAGSTLAAVSSFSAMAEEANAEVERIEVTGSRIKRTDLESAVPITSISRADFEAVGALNVADILNQSPVSIEGLGTSNNTFAGSSIGLQTTQLRGLGSSRTLVLVNGRRFVSGLSPSVGYAVDLNSIPTALIERIDILKSASSAIYGSDAVAGVVNIITRKDIEGVEVDVQTGRSGDSDRNKFALNITTGGSWNTGNATFAMGFDDDKGLQGSDREFSKYDQAITVIDGQEQVTNLFSSFSPYARIGSPGSGYIGTGESFKNVNDDTGHKFNRAAYRQLSTPIERKYAAFSINQEINDSVRYFAEANFNMSQTKGSTIEPTPFDIVDDVWFKDRGGVGGMSVYSPLVPDLLRENLLADGITDLNQTAFVRRMLEFGARSTDVERTTIRIAHGLDWDINDDWSANAYMTWGRTNQTQENGGQINVERTANALDVNLDANGNMQCVSQAARLNGCVPFNIFQFMGASQEAIDYIKSPAKTSGVTEQFVLSGTVAGELPLELSGGNVAMAFGVEHRLEKGEYNPGDLAQVGASSTNKSDPTDGSFYSNDVFVEFNLPVLDNLSVDAAARYSDHEIVGGQTTWNLGVEYSPIETLKLRASAATAVRTPNIADLFGGRGETFRNVSDPCNGLQLDGSDPLAADVRANCLANADIAARVTSTGEFALTQVELQSAGGTTGGNPDVKEETADTFSAGFVWQAMEGLSITVDYYDIAIENAIATTSRTTVIRRCYEVAPGEFNANCNGAFTRNSVGALTEVHSGTSNENDLDVSGIDIEVSYRADLGPGTFGADLLWNHTREYVQTSIEGGEEVDFVGEVLNPDNRANLNLSYALEDVSFTWGLRYWDRSLETAVEGGNFSFPLGDPLTTYGTFASYIYHDASAAYNFTDTISGRIGIRNVFDKQPPVANQSSANGSTGINTIPEAYDVTGRYFTASLSMKF